MAGPPFPEYLPKLKDAFPATVVMMPVMASTLGKGAVDLSTGTGVREYCFGIGCSTSDYSAWRLFRLAMISYLLELGCGSVWRSMVTVWGGFGSDYSVPSTPRPLIGTYSYLLTYLLTYLLELGWGSVWLIRCCSHLADYVVE